MKKISLGIVIAALAVSISRLTLVSLLGYGVEIPPGIELTILISTGLGSGIVLTVGNALLAHALATRVYERSPLWWIGAAAWGTLVVGAVIIVAPTLVVGARGPALSTVLTSPAGEWLWAICAAAIVEVLVAAVVVATVLVEQPNPAATSDRWSTVWDALAARLAYLLTPEIQPPFRENYILEEIEDLLPEETLTWFSVDPAQNDPFEPIGGGFVLTEPFVAAPVLVESESDIGIRRTVQDVANRVMPPGDVASHAHMSSPPPRANEASDPLPQVAFRARTKAEALERTIEHFRSDPHASVAQVAESIGRSAKTVRGYLAELESTNQIKRHDDEIHVL